MGKFEICIIGFGLAMDAFAVAVCKGLSIKKNNIKKTIIISIYFGTFQAVMPLLGYYLGNTFQDIVCNIDHWIAFILLVIIGINMIKDSFLNDEINTNENTDLKTMFPLAIATSIDAFAIGVTFAFFQVNIHIAIVIIGFITFFLSLIGVKIGNMFGYKFKDKAELLGGIVLIFMGTKILIEHLI